jgi:hypothetical protein
MQSRSASSRSNRARPAASSSNYARPRAIRLDQRGVNISAACRPRSGSPLPPEASSTDHHALLGVTRGDHIPPLIAGPSGSAGTPINPKPATSATDAVGQKVATTRVATQTRKTPSRPGEFHRSGTGDAAKGPGKHFSSDNACARGRAREMRLRLCKIREFSA